QFTYFQQVGGVEVSPISVELTYGLERIAMYIQNTDHFRNIKWNNDTLYGEIFYQKEKEFSEFNFQAADTKELFDSFQKNEQQCNQLIAKSLVYPAYDYLLKCSHSFNLLDARGVISVTERAAYIARIRKLAKECATQSS
ncbi:MAG: glycine--tRNA ligase subunit alpha, partial [Candidatus Cloacimonetes bacterium]|nr:glycine--tRNA ligase subunit alpha [Candidatus Cloacimonadota bacterium]